MKKWRLNLVLAIIVLAGFILSLFGWLTPVRNAFWNTVAPLNLVFRSTVGKLASVKNIFYMQRILKQNGNLVNENLELKSRLVKLEEVEYENEILKKELGFLKTQKGTDYIPASVVGQSQSGYVRTLTIDKGLDANLEEGQAVIAQGFLIGKIIQVRQNNADLRLLTDYSSLIPVVFQKSRGTGLLRGGLQGLTVEDVPLNASIEKSEMVVTSGLGGEIPPGIAVGNAQEIMSKPGEVFQKVSVQSPVDFSRLEVLLVVKTND